MTAEYRQQLTVQQPPLQERTTKPDKIIVVAVVAVVLLVPSRRGDGRRWMGFVGVGFELVGVRCGW